MPEPYGIETAGSFGTGNSYVIVSVGTTDFTLVGAAANRPGVVFEATGAGAGTGTARRLNSQLGRIGGKLLADNLLRDGIDLAVKNTAYDDPVLYLRVGSEVNEVITAPQLIAGVRYQIRSVGTTPWTVFGSPNNNVGTRFVATINGIPLAGTGTAYKMDDDAADTDAADALDPNPTSGIGRAIGVNTDSPTGDLDVNDDIRSTNAEATSQFNIANIIINSSGTITTTVGPLYISPAGHDPVIFHDRMTTNNLYFTDNTIGSFSNSNIVFNPSGSGSIQLTANTNLTGNLSVTGNVQINGNLSTPNSITFGDSSINPGPSPRDTIDFNTFISQDLNPGISNEFNLGSPSNKWGDAWIPDWTNASNLYPSRMRVSDQVIINGVDNQIFALQSNDDLKLLPDTGIVYIEDTKWQDSDITNLSTSTPIQIDATGTGYYRFAGTNGFVIPAGSSAQRPARPELGDTRWNTDEEYLESFAGEIDAISFSGSVSGLIDQILILSAITLTGSGTGATFRVTILSSILNVEIINPGQAYITGDQLRIPGTSLLGGISSPNDIFITVGAQINDGYIISTGGGEEVTLEVMDDLSNLYSLILG